MKFEGFGSKGTRVIERKRSVTDGQTDGRTRQKQYVSLRGGGGDITICGVLDQKGNNFVFFKGNNIIN